MKTVYTNILKSIVFWFIITILNLIIYLATFPTSIGLFQHFPYIMYIGIALNIIVSVVGYMICGKLTGKIKNKYITVLSLSIPSIIGIISLIFFFLTKYMWYLNLSADWISLPSGLIGAIAIITNISCGFIINFLIGTDLFVINILSVLVSLIPVMFMFIGNQLSHKKEKESVFNKIKDRNDRNNK